METPRNDNDPISPSEAQEPGLKIAFGGIERMKGKVSEKIRSELADQLASAASRSGVDQMHKTIQFAEYLIKEMVAYVRRTMEPFDKTEADRIVSIIKQVYPDIKII